MQKSVWWNFFRSQLKHCDCHDPYRETPMCNFSGEASRIILAQLTSISHPPLRFCCLSNCHKNRRFESVQKSWRIVIPRHKSRDLFRPNLKKSGWLASFNRGSLEAALCCCFPGTPGTARHSDVASWNEGHLEPGKPKAQRWILAINTHIEKTFLESIHQSLVPKINKIP